MNQFHSSQCKWESGGSVSTSGWFNTYIANGTFSAYSGGQVYFVDGFTWPMANVNSLSGITLFNNWGYWGVGAGFHHQFFRLGTQLINGYCEQFGIVTDSYNLNGDIYNSGDIPGWPQGWNYGSTSTPLTGNSSNLGFEVELGVWEMSNSSVFQVMMFLESQPIFEGSCNYSPLTP